METVILTEGGTTAHAITVEIKPEVETELAAQAAVRGMDVRAYVASLLEDAAQQSLAKARGQAARRQQLPGRKSLARLFAESPFKGLDLDFERDRDFGRDIDL